MSSVSAGSNYTIQLEGNKVVIAKTESEEDQFQAFIDAMQNRKPKKAEVSDITYEPLEGCVHSIMRTSMMSMNTRSPRTWMLSRAQTKDGSNTRQARRNHRCDPRAETKR